MSTPGRVLSSEHRRLIALPSLFDYLSVIQFQKEAFYQELIGKTGQGRLSSHDHFAKNQHLNEYKPYDPSVDSAEAFIGPPSKVRHAFQPLKTPESEKSSLKLDKEAVQRSATPEVIVAARNASGEVRRPSLLGEQETKPPSDELVTLSDFIKGTEEELITVQDFLRKEIGRGK